MAIADLMKVVATPELPDESGSMEAHGAAASCGCSGVDLPDGFAWLSELWDFRNGRWCPKNKRRQSRRDHR